MYIYKELSHSNYSKLSAFQTFDFKAVEVCEKQDDGIIKPICVLTNYYQNEEERIKDLEVKEDDIWITGYPRSGTTWTQEMMWLISHDLDFETARKVEQAHRSVYLEGFTFKKDFDSINQVNNLKSPRNIKTHLPVKMLPDQIWTKNPKIFYVARDPKDVVVSWYHLHRMLLGYVGTLEQFVDSFLKDEVIISPYWDHVLSYWKLRNEKNVLFIRYEELKKDLLEVLKKVCDFLNKQYTEEQMKELEEHLDFKNMKANSSCDRAKSWKRDATDSEFIRKGQVGGWKEEMDQEMADKIDAWTKEKLAGTDYKLLGDD